MENVLPITPAPLIVQTVPLTVQTAPLTVQAAPLTVQAGPLTVQVFEELLLDADWSLNAANWMWLSASAFFHQFFRVYSPVAFGKKTDPTGDYIKKYLPKLRK